MTFGAAEYTAREAFAKKGTKKNKTEEALLSLSSYSLLLLFPDSALTLLLLLLIIRKKKHERRTVVRSRVPNAGGHVPRPGPDRRPVGVRRERRGHERNDDEVISDESKQTRRELDEFCWNWRRVRGRAEERKHGWGWRGC